MMKKRIVFLHPDLGIGGAERLVVDAALALKSRGHLVHFVTNHHDPNHCFEETTNGQLTVTVIGDWMPRSIFGRCRAFWAYLRIVIAAIYISCKGLPASSNDNLKRYRPDVIICDQISACIPFLKDRPSLSWLLPYTPKKIVFYCHFPDKLLTKRHGTFKKLYRYFIDWVEEATTGMADKILVNSKYTAGIFHDTFTSLNIVPDVVYPSLHTKAFDEELSQHHSTLDHQKESETFLLLSINRYERKKNLPLALKTLATLHNQGFTKARLVMMGGHDPLCTENVEHLHELKALANDLNLSSTGNDPSVIFKTNATTEEKINYLRISDALLYTPSGEHFGIVPVEAMYVGLPVIAINDGAGPTESVKDNETGFLCESEESSFAEAIIKLMNDTNLQNRMKEFGRRRVREKFSFESFTDQLHTVLNREAENGVNENVPVSNGEIKSDKLDCDAPENEPNSDKAKYDEGNDTLASKYEDINASYEDKVIDSSKCESPESHSKTSTAEKFRRRFSLRSLKFHRAAAKTSIDEAETSGSELERKNSSETIEGKSVGNHKNLVNGDMVKNSGDGERSFDEQGFKEAQTSSNRKGTFCNGDIPDEGNEIFYEENS